jgi:hypothetical protein
MQNSVDTVAGMRASLAAWIEKPRVQQGLITLISGDAGKIPGFRISAFARPAGNL